MADRRERENVLARLETILRIQRSGVVDALLMARARLAVLDGVAAHLPARDRFVAGAWELLVSDARQLVGELEAAEAARSAEGPAATATAAALGEGPLTDLTAGEWLEAMEGWCPPPRWPPDQAFKG